MKYLSLLPILILAGCGNPKPCPCQYTTIGPRVTPSETLWTAPVPEAGSPGYVVYVLPDQPANDETRGLINPWTVGTVR